MNWQWLIDLIPFLGFLPLIGATLTHGTALPDSAGKADFYAMMDNGTVTGIVNADCAAGMALVDTKLATISTAGKVNTSALATTSGAQGDVLYHDGSGWTRLGAGTAKQILNTGGAGANPSWIFGGKIVQVVNTISGAMITGNTVTPYDDTIPAITEGAQFLSRTITPKSASNYLVVLVEVNVSSSAAGHSCLALHNSGAAIACSFFLPTADGHQNVSLIHYMQAPATSEQTFTVRIGDSAGSTFTLNGTTGARNYGGILMSSITIVEVAA